MKAMDTLIRSSLRNRPLVMLATALLVFFGVTSGSRMPVDVFPDLTAPTVTVLTEAHGMAPTEVESQVTFPIETALNGAPGIRRVRSSTAVGTSIVWAEFDWGTEIRGARQIVSERLALAANDLPPEIEKPVLAPTSSIMGEIMFLSLSSTNHTAIELRTTADSVVRRRLLAVPGISQVTPIGGKVKQYQVVIDPVTMKAFDVTLDQVMTALTEGNENISAGVINERGSEWLVTGLGRIRNLEDIGETVVTSRDGVPITMDQLGQVVIGARLKRGEASAHGQLAVLLGIQKQPNANTLALTERLDEVLGDMARRLPEGMVLDSHIFRQADFIEVAINNVRTALLEGVVVVILVVLLFLTNVRATLITVTAIPLSLLVTVLVLQAFGSTVNTMTLGGMAIAIGALVDDAVIDVENVFRRLRQNASRPSDQQRSALRVVLDASVEIRSSIMFATFIIALVFIPLFFLSGVEGRLLKPLGVAYLTALLTSLLVAVSVTPVMCSYLLPQSRAVREPRESAFVRRLKAIYDRLLTGVLNHPWRVTVTAFTLWVASLVSLPFMGRDFLPDFNEGSLTVTAVTLPGTSLQESDRLARTIETILLSHPEVVSTGRRTGRAELNEHALGVESSEIEVTLSMKERSKASFLEALRADLSQVPGMNISIGQPISHRIDHMLSGTRAKIAVKIFGPDLYRLRELGREVESAMTGVEGVVDLAMDQQTDVPTLKVAFNRPALARHGLTIREAAHFLEAAIQGHKASEILEGQNSFDLVIRLSTPKGWQLDDFGALLVDTPAGAKVPLSALATITREAGPNLVSREQVERKIVVQCNVAGRDVTGVVNDIREQITPLLDQAKGYRVEYGGQFESAAAANQLLIALGLIVIIGIGFLLQLAFNSMRDALLVMVNLPLALIGGVVGVFITGGIISVASLIGFITVFGIATRNGIMLVSHIRHLQAVEGISNLREAVHQGALERLVPILMTALATAVALIPLALGGGKPGNEIQTPMAIVILSGLTSSMLLNMVVVPALYLRFGRPPETKEALS